MIQVQTEPLSYTITFEHEHEREHIEAMLHALSIFSERSALYRQSWRRYGAIGAAFFVKDRGNRIWDGLRFESALNPSDVFDVVNYAIFCLRSHYEGNLGGEFWPEATPPLPSKGKT